MLDYGVEVSGDISQVDKLALANDIANLDTMSVLSGVSEDAF